MSNERIADELGISEPTVRRSGSSNDEPDQEIEGKDGKTYKSTKPTQDEINERREQAAVFVGWGGDRKSKEFRGNQDGNHHLEPGTHKAYILKRLERDNPEILEAFKRGEYRSARQAGIAAVEALPMLEAEAKERQRLSEGRGKKGKEKIPYLNGVNQHSRVGGPPTLSGYEGTNDKTYILARLKRDNPYLESIQVFEARTRLGFTGGT